MSDLEDVLVDVRKAYRLLHVFNSRIFDLMKYIESSFEMKFGGGRSIFTADTPKSFKGQFGNWIWDYFNLYFYEFYFKADNDNVWLSVILQSDTGLWDIIDDIKDEDEFERKENKIEKFNSPEDSRTRLLFVTGTGKWSEEKINKIYNTNLNKNTVDPLIISSGDKGKILCKTFEVNKFIDEMTTRKTLNEYINFLLNNGFDKIKCINKND